MLNDVSLENLEKFNGQLKDYLLWRNAVDTAKEIFGDDVQGVEISTDYESNDEGGSYYPVRGVQPIGGSFKATDMWWADKIESHNEYVEKYPTEYKIFKLEDEDEESQRDQLMEEFNDSVIDAFYYLLDYADHQEYGPEGEYYVDNPPTVDVELLRGIFE